MKDFKKFLEEVTIRGNPGIPGEGDDTPRGERRFLSDIERRAKDRLEVTGRENPMQLGQRIMQLLGQSQEFVRGNEEELEKLATDIIMLNYGDILEGVRLDIKLVRSGSEVAQFMEDEKCEDCQEQEPQQFRSITDPDLIKRIHKAKLGNTIIQGEAKNTKHILHSEEVKDGLVEIYDENRADEIFNIWDEITKIADKMDWIIPINIKANMMERAPEGMAGAVKVEWEESETKKDEEVGANLINDLSEFDLNPEDVEEFQELMGDSTPVIKARGIDFPMLLHETVKGIYELIVAVSLPREDASEEEIRKAETIRLNVSSFEDEAEDFRTGPEIAADLRDFINENPRASYHPNMREYVFGKMMDETVLNPEEFLTLFRGILNKTDEAREKIDSIISSIIRELREYEFGGVMDIDDQDDIEIPIEDEVSPDELSQNELQELIDDALDREDYDKVRELSKYLKESRIYINELENIKKNHQYRRKN